MTAIGVEFVTGVCRAEERHRRDHAEWPPHPDRLFMALMATVHEVGVSPDPGELDALRWLASRPPPSLSVVLLVSHRTVVTTFVPTNDDRITTKVADVEHSSDQRIALQVRLLPGERGRKPRTLPAVVPADPRVFYRWDAAAPPPVLRSLTTILSRVSRIGRSASLVRAWIEASPPDAVLVPSDGVSDLRLRVPTPGRLEVLAEHWSRDDGPPPMARRQGYRIVSGTASTKAAVRDRHVLFLRRVSGVSAHLEHVLLAVELLRRAIMRRCSVQPVPEWISGHASDGRPSREDHLAILPLMDAGSRQRAMTLLGFALVTPSGVPPATRREVLEEALTGGSIHGPLRIWGGRDGWFEWTLAPARDGDAPINEEIERLTGGTEGATTWASVTPVVLDRHSRRRASIVDSIAQSIGRLGLPVPMRIEVGTSSAIPGVPPSSMLPRTRRGDGKARQQWHCKVEFATPVRGPLAVGAGRFLGYGLLRAVPRGAA